MFLIERASIDRVRSLQREQCDMLPNINIWFYLPEPKEFDNEVHIFIYI